MEIRSESGYSKANENINNIALNPEKNADKIVINTNATFI